MSKYKVTLGDLDKRDPERKLKALKELREGPRTAIQLSALWSIDETTSYRLLKRFHKQGLVECEDGRASFRGEYKITERGIEKLGYWEEYGTMSGPALVSKIKIGLAKHLCKDCLQKLKKFGLA